VHRKPLLDALPWVGRRLRGTRRLWIASDFDGTLAPIVRRPEAARMSASARRVLRRLVALEGVEVAILSGRALADLRRRVRIGGVFLAGTAGLVTQAPGERPVSHLPKGRSLEPGLRAALRAWCAHFPAAWVENKGPGLALHYGELAERLRPAFRLGTRRLMRSRGEAVTITDGKNIVEIAPAVRWNKASALRAWRRRRRGLLFYFGDDANDEPAYRHVRARRGVTVAVGPPRAGAEYGLASCADVVRVLEWLARAWTERHRSPHGVAPPPRPRRSTRPASRRRAPRP